jgi:nitroreductase
MPYPSGPLEGLLRPEHATEALHRAEFFELPRDEAALRTLLESKPQVRITDRIRAQLGELIKAQHPGTKYTPAELEQAITAHLAGKPPAHHGAWVYYPWNDRLVHLLGEEEFQVVRTDRNRNKITREEQAVLATKKVGVIGLSVGQSVSLAMALERSFGEIRLADFDTLDLSNLNRLRSGVHNLGLNKAVITAREIAEVDPYLKVTCFIEGLTKENMDAFFTGGGRLDILVEECDSVDIKILARQKAKALGIPVVMDMSDRGCLDVERFDLEPERPLMHGWIDHLDLSAAGRAMTTEEKLPYMLPISGVDSLSPRMKASMIELEQTISTWPQLATSVVLGGALAGDAVRRIALGQFSASGRWFVDLEEIVADPAGDADLVQAGSPRKEFGMSPKQLGELVQSLGPEPLEAISIREEEMLTLVEAGGAAPSAGNMQPWRFTTMDRRLILLHDEARSRSALDPDHRIAHIALGASMENIVLKAHDMGYEVRVRNEPLTGCPSFVAAFEFHRPGSMPGETHEMDHLSAMIGKRCTNRRSGKREPVPSDLLQSVLAAARSLEGCNASMIHTVEDLREIASICGAAERIRVMNPTGHEEFFRHEVRWTAKDASRSMDGLDLETMEVTPMAKAGLQIASDPRAMALVKAWGGGRSLEMHAEQSILSSSAVILVHVAGDSIPQRLAGGRAVERLWMAANARGWSIHPISAPVFLTHVLQYALKELNEREQEELKRLEARMLALFPELGSNKPLFLMRMALAGTPTVRSMRRPAHSLLLEPFALPH